MSVAPQVFALFLLAVLVLLVTPGPNMMFVLTSGAAHGWRGGLAAALGIGVVDLLFTLACALGLATLLAAEPAAFNAIQWIGAAYLIYLAYSCLRAARTSADPTGGRQDPFSTRSLFLRGLGSNLANPKAILFYIVFIPQFVDIGRGPVLAQFILLGCALAVLGVLFHGTLGAIGSAGAALIGGRPAVRRRLHYVQAAVFALVAGRLLFG